MPNPDTTAPVTTGAVPPAGAEGAGAPPPAGDAATTPAGAPPAVDPKAGTTPPPPADSDLKLPEGFKANEASLAEFKKLAKDHGLKGDAAQKIFDLYASEQKAALEKRAADVEAEHQAWAKAIEADKELGGQNLTATKDACKRALAKFGGAGLEKILNESGLGDHPEVVRFVAKIGRELAEDSIAGTGGASAEVRGINSEAFTNSLYPTMNKES